MRIETRPGNLYDFPGYYDIVFGGDWRAEFGFLRACFARYAGRPVSRVFEPACGTGRLLVRLGTAGYDVAGNDINPAMVEYCNARLARRGLRARVVVADMTDFRLRRRVDAAFNTINSFRHLASEQAAESHLRCVAEALAKGGIYVLGLHLTPTRGAALEEESWSGRRGASSVTARIWTIALDRRRRHERVGMTCDVATRHKRFRLAHECSFRTYTAAQFRRLLARVPELEPVSTFDFNYQIDEPTPVAAETQDVVYILRKR